MLPLTALLAAALAGDWPQFRGPNADGRYQGPPPPLEWSETKNLAWSVPIAGAGWSSPVVADGKVFLTAAVPQGTGPNPDQSLRALALDAATGKELWNVEFRQQTKSHRIHGKNRHASSSPLWHDGALYVHFGYMGTAKLDAKTGKELWHNFDLHFPPVHGNGGSPFLFEGKLIFTCDGKEQPYVAALDAATGKLAWRTDRTVKAANNKHFSFCTPQLATVEGKPQALCVGSNLLAAYDPLTGKELWKFTTPDGFSTIPQPALGKGLAVYAIGYESAELIAVRLAGNQGDVTKSHQAWSLKRGAPMTPSPLIAGDELYIVSDNGIASCLDLATGKQHWQERLAGNFSASPLLIDGHVLYLSEKGAAYVVKAGREKPTVQRNDLVGATLATPAVADGAIYLRTDAKLHKIARAQ